MLYTDLLMRKKYWFSPNLDFNHLFAKINFINFCIHGQSACSTSREKRTSKHGINKCYVFRLFPFRLIHRPPHSLVFDCLQYAASDKKLDVGKAWGLG